MLNRTPNPNWQQPSNRTQNHPSYFRPVPASPIIDPQQGLELETLMLPVQLPPASSVLTTTIIRTSGPPAGKTGVSIVRTC